METAEERVGERDQGLKGQHVLSHARCDETDLTITRMIVFNGSWRPLPNKTLGQRNGSSLSSWLFGSDQSMLCPRYERLEGNPQKKPTLTSHTQTTTFAIQDLCLHPEYIEPLREECQSAAYADFERTARGLPLLDSFIKESARLTPVESCEYLSLPPHSRSLQMPANPLDSSLQ